MADISRYRFVFVLAALILLLGAPVSAELQVELKAPQAEEFCGSSQPPAELLCPKTLAPQCLCYLNAKNPGNECEINLPPSEDSEKTRPRRKRTSYHLLPSSSCSMSVVTYDASVPTPPPRQ